MHGTERIQKQKKLYPVTVTALVCNMHTGSTFSVLVVATPLLGILSLICRNGP